MASTRSGSGGNRALGKAIGVGATIAGGLALVAAASAAYAVARVARTVITPVRRRPHREFVHGVDEALGTITLKRTPDAAMPGRFGLWFGSESGYAKLGGLLETTDGSVVRELERVHFGEFGPGRARISGYYYLEPEELGLPVESVAIETDLGQAPAWVFPADDSASGDRWVIQVHGWGATRQEGLRAVPTFHAAGYTSLLASYRNDGDAPESADRRYGLGGTEWRDIDAAIRYAADRGARSIVLMGWSMGGAVVLQTVTRSQNLDLVDGVILESPVVDWIDTLEFQANMLRLPDAIAQGAMRLIASTWSGPITGLGAPIDLRSMDFVARAADLSLPMLILHSQDDGFVPSTPPLALSPRRAATS
ncbi:alpha/beta hydrolase family protein [Leifsonia sp. L25]|uniref:alpha/beta hydrolase family protein n=1 Tax=Leifsonia sp. L25 TaxID=3423957 RepID=UPI003D684636